MNDKINGRTPEEIKKGLECCKPQWEHDRWISCSDDCPFMNEGTFCRIKMQACVSALLQQLERERDAAVKDIARTCLKCAHRERRFLADGKLDDLCGTCIYNNMCNWEWRGVQEVQHGTE